MVLFDFKGASIYAFHTEGGGGCQKIPQLCVQTVHSDKGGREGKKIPKFCGRHIWKPPYDSMLLLKWEAKGEIFAWNSTTPRHLAHPFTDLLP